MQQRSSCLLKRLLWAICAVWALVAGVVPFEALAFESPSAAVIAWEQLPVQGRQTHERILRGGPFPYEKDGTVFGNRERKLPKQPRGYYREYTVPTPGSRDRGARRIVCGGARPTQPVACYYTDDHYTSFRLIGARAG